MKIFLILLCSGLLFLLSITACSKKISRLGQDTPAAPAKIESQNRPVLVSEPDPNCNDCINESATSTPAPSLQPPLLLPSQQRPLRIPSMETPPSQNELRR